MRKLASIVKIEEIKPIENADRIEKIRIKEWWCVSEKGNFKIGDLAVYFEIDSLMPSSNPAFQFLAKGCSEKIMNIDGKEYKGYRLKTRRLKGELSQGLALPLKALISMNFQDIEVVEGTDVSELLGIIKYEAPIPTQLAGVCKGSFPSDIPKTDEERVQNLGELIKQYAGTIMYITEKLEGSSITIYKKNGELGVCSRNLELLETNGNSLWKIANQYNLKNLLPEGFAIQGELVGESIQKNPLKLQGQDLYVFNVFDITKQKYLNLDEFEKFVSILNLKTVPILTRACSLPSTVEEILSLADDNSAISSSVKREGIVIRPLQEMIVEIDEYPARFTFKAISNSYLLQND